MDPRETPFNGRIAHSSLKGIVEAEEFTNGEPFQIGNPVAPITSQDGTKRLREAVLGERFLVLDRADGRAFGMLARDGYVGYVSEEDLVDLGRLTQRVRAARTYAKPSPDLKTFEAVIPLSFGSQIETREHRDGWSHTRIKDQDYWIPTLHLSERDVHEDDPIKVAELFLGTPYLWGGNSAFGIDCSGLVQAAFHACALPCPGDSDQQERELGDQIDFKDVGRGDLIFWEGHVALVVDPETILHANAHHMAVVKERLKTAVGRIASTETGPVTSCVRPKKPT